MFANIFKQISGLVNFEIVERISNVSHYLWFDLLSIELLYPHRCYLLLINTTILSVSDPRESRCESRVFRADQEDASQESGPQNHTPGNQGKYMYIRITLKKIEVNICTVY